MSYEPTIYQWAAAHYRRGRPGYSPQLEAVLTEELGLNGTGRLLDGGCGPGVLPVRLAPLFEQAVGLDPDAAMLDEGRRLAERRGITNIRWVHARAEDLPAAAPAPYRVSPSASPSTGRTRPAWPRSSTTSWSRVAPWPWSVTPSTAGPCRRAPGPRRSRTRRSRRWWRSTSGRPGAPVRAWPPCARTASRTSSWA